jgi:hypothetical protein
MIQARLFKNELKSVHFYKEEMGLKDTHDVLKAVE